MSGGVRRKPAVAHLTPAERDELVRYLIVRSNELNLAMSSLDVADARYERAVRETTKAECDFEHATNPDLPITVSRLRRHIREIGALPRCAFYYQAGAEERDVAEALAFPERARFWVARALASRPEAGGHADA